MADLEPEFNHVYNELARQVSRGVYRSRGVNGSRGVYRSRGVRGVHERHWCRTVNVAGLYMFFTK